MVFNSYLFNRDGSLLMKLTETSSYVHYEGMFLVSESGDVFCWEDLGAGFGWQEPDKDTPNLDKVKAAALLLKG